MGSLCFVVEGNDNVCHDSYFLDPVEGCGTVTEYFFYFFFTQEIEMLESARVKAHSDGRLRLQSENGNEQVKVLSWNIFVA